MWAGVQRCLNLSTYGLVLMVSDCGAKSLGTDEQSNFCNIFTALFIVRLAATFCALVEFRIASWRTVVRTAVQHPYSQCRELSCWRSGCSRDLCWVELVSKLLPKNTHASVLTSSDIPRR